MADIEAVLAGPPWTNKEQGILLELQAMDAILGKLAGYVPVLERCVYKSTQGSLHV